MKHFLQFFFVLISAVGFSQWQPLTFSVTGGDCDEVTGSSEIFISEVYDSPGGSDGVIEIYNPTNAPINLSTYRIRRSGDYGSGNWDNFGGAWNGAAGQALSGILASGDTYLIVFGAGGTPCPISNPDLVFGQSYGINGNDQIQLLKNTTILDDVRTPASVGFTLIRRPDAEVPKPIFNNADWLTTGQNCAGLGSHTIDPTTPPEIDNISRYRDNPGTIPYTFCATPTRVRVQMDSMGGTYAYSYNLQGTTTPINLTNTTGIFSNLQEDVYNLTVTVRKNGLVLCTIIAQFTITGGTQTSPIILQNP